ncbi:MAG: hypothetical protein KAT05_17675 [Spirochaetes bacterium]|nr:hypothetical protein [Spirochaetota bacterium]
MKRNIFLFIFLIIIISSSYSDGTNDSIISTISKTNIKIGEKITLLLKVPDLKDVKVLWEDMSELHQEVEIYSKKDFYKGKYLNFEIIFTFFYSGDYEGFIFTIPISTPDGEMLYLETDKYNIIVESPLTEEEIENLKNIKDPSKIELRKEKEQVKIAFHFSTYIKIILFIIGFILLAMIIYYFLYKKIMKKRKEDEIKKLPPYQRFLADLEIILFDVKDDRKIVEKKLSELTEILKELIYGELFFNAPSETTKELIISLKQTEFDPNIIAILNDLFNEIDMIKFAKAPVNYDRLKYYVDTIRKLGNKIHNYKMSILKEEEG